MMWVKMVVGVFALFLAGLGWAILYGARRWRISTESFITELNSRRLEPHRLRYDDSEVEGLPNPVARYFRTVLRNGQPIVTGARLEQKGQFRMGDAEESWRPFASTQFVSSRPPGFVWDATIRMAPGLPVHVRDAYLTDAGSMHAEVLGLVRVVDVGGTPEMAAGALQRYLAEAVWIPTALLPSQGVRWTAIDDSSARATLTDGETTVSLEFRFSAEGEITSAYSASRPREVKGAFEATPWECRYAAYVERDGMRIPIEGEVEWHLADRAYSIAVRLRNPAEVHLLRKRCRREAGCRRH